MATLTEVAYISRYIIKYSGVVLVAYIILQGAVKFGINMYRQLNPPPPAPPSMGFGLIPPIRFPQGQQYQYNFNLELPTGTFPDFSDRASVFYVPPQKASLLASQEAEKLAQAYRFAGKGEQIGINLFQWQKRIPQPLTLKVDAVSGAFAYEYQWQADTSLLSDKVALTEDEVYQKASVFIKQSGQNFPDIDFAKGKLSYYKATEGKLTPSLSLSEADFAKVDYFRNDIAETGEITDTGTATVAINSNTGSRQVPAATTATPIPVVTYKPQDGIISITLSKSSQYDKQIIAARFDYYSVNYEQPETYPLTPVALAWEQLKSGQAYIASNNNNTDKITIRRVFLAYFDPPKQQDFLQPVYVFTGDNEFVAYVPAISDIAIKR